MPETVSVIIPIYNREKLISRTIRSVLDDASRSGIDLQMIVIDDGSTDKSIDVARSFGSKIKIVRQQHLGPNAARNRGLALADGNYIRFIDSDDWLLSRDVTKQQIELMKCSGADVCYGDWFDSYEGAIDNGSDVLRSREEMKDPVESLLDDRWCASFCYLYRREIVLASGGWTEDLPACQDFDFVLKIALAGSKFIRYNGIIGHYYHHSCTRVSQENPERWCDSKQGVINEAITWLNNHHDWTPGRRRAAANSLLNLGKVYFQFNPSKFRMCIQDMQEVCPEFRPPKLIYRWLVNLFGYSKAEAVLQMKRNLLGSEPKTP